MKIESITINLTKSATFYHEIGDEYHTFNSYSYISSSVSRYIYIYMKDLVIEV